MESIQPSVHLILDQTNHQHAEKVQSEPIFAPEKTFTGLLRWVSLVVKPTSSIFPDSTPQYVTYIVFESVLLMRYNLDT